MVIVTYGKRIFDKCNYGKCNRAIYAIFFYPDFAEISTNILPRYNFLLIFIIPYFLVYIRFYRDYYQNDTQKFLFIKYYNSFFSCLYKFLQRLLPIYYPDNSFY